MRRRIAVILVLILLFLLGAVFYFITAGPKQVPSPEKPVQAEEMQGHQHGGGAPPSAPEQEVVPMEEEKPTVEIPQDKQQMIGVKTSVAQIKPMVKIIRTVGRVAYDETKLATINIKFEGWIEKLYVNYTGDYVKKGQPLAEIYSPELYATEQEYLNVLKWAKEEGASGQNANSGNTQSGNPQTIDPMLKSDARSLVEAARQRLMLFDISEREIKKIEESGKPIRNLSIYSPVSGYVVDKPALQGLRVMPGDKLFDIADLSTVWILADIYTADLPLIKVGETATLTLSYFPGKEFRSRIDYIYPTLSGETRTVKVRFTIPNEGGKLKPQMFSDVLIKTRLGPKLVVPESAVINTGKRKLVYVDKGEGLFEPREVETGASGDGMVQILSGLKQGEKVASSAAFLIDSEARLKGVVQ